jgi:transglutaminase-like putative cysteine protease
MKKLKITVASILVIIMFLAVTTSCFGAATVFKGTKSEIDVTNASDGYVKVRYLNETAKKLKVIIQKGTEKYTYDLNGKGEYDTYPLQMGDGKYKISVYENIVLNRYSTKQTAYVEAKLKDQNAPFLVPNQLVNYSAMCETVKKAAELTEGKTTDIEKLDAIYEYIISNIKYDTLKAQTVKSGYLPNVDEILTSSKGICFDYAAIMASMLRSQSIPAKLVTGYSSNLSAYHEWNEVYTDETGWIILNEMYFDGNKWNLMDSTLASSAKQSNSERVMEYTYKLIDGKYYTKQFEY